MTDEPMTADSENPDASNETVDQATRETLLEEYGHRCQGCGRRGPGASGLATLQVHHIERNPDDMDEHDPTNLTVLCRSCHTWLHQQARPNDSPVEITAADESVLLPQDIEILRYLADNGPTKTGDIAAEVQGDSTVASVRQRLWLLMGLDNFVEQREKQVVDKDIETGEWGLVEQVENSARGHIPDNPQILAQRVEDEQVRQALECGVDRNTVSTVFDVSRRTTFNKEKRARAFDFPLEAFSRSRGGRPAADTTPSQNATVASVSAETEDETTDGTAQQRLDTDTEQQQSAEQSHPTTSTAPNADVHNPQEGADEPVTEGSTDGSDNSEREQVVIDMTDDEAQIREKLRKLLETLDNGDVPQ
ncbi:HNH endonuclease [Halovenus halobia]|uniref:HNH endonuclease n=1 Tax=Halovenus halobia TaxID=3396622 RepID=UPI003F5496F4